MVDDREPDAERRSQARSMNCSPGFETGRVYHPANTASALQKTAGGRWPRAKKCARYTAHQKTRARIHRILNPGKFI